MLFALNALNCFFSLSFFLGGVVSLLPRRRCTPKILNQADSSASMLTSRARPHRVIFFVYLSRRGRLRAMYFLIDVAELPNLSLHIHNIYKPSRNRGNCLMCCGSRLSAILSPLPRILLRLSVSSVPRFCFRSFSNFFFSYQSSSYRRYPVFMFVVSIETSPLTLSSNNFGSRLLRSNLTSRDNARPSPHGRTFNGQVSDPAWE